LKQSEIVFADKAFVGGQHQHSSITGLAELLQVPECSEGRHRVACGKPGAVSAPEFHSMIYPGSVRTERDILEGELQLLSFGLFAATVLVADITRVVTSASEISPTADDKGILGRLFENVIGDDERAGL